MARFFVDPEQIKGDQLEVTGPEAKHILQVLRLKPGDIITVLDGQGNEYRTGIEKVTGTVVQCRVISSAAAGGEPSLRVMLIQGLAKGDRMETVIQKATELGVAGIIPAQCSRSVVRLDGHKALEKQRRWQRVALEAAKQCRRGVVPRVDLPRNWYDVLSDLPLGCPSLLPWEGETACSLHQALTGFSREKIGNTNVYIFIGPEGGFEPAEVEAARARGVVSVSLGPRILRTETAGPALLAVIMYLWGDLGGFDNL